MTEGPMRQAGCSCGLGAIDSVVLIIRPASLVNGHGNYLPSCVGTVKRPSRPGRMEGVGVGAGADIPISGDEAWTGIGV